MSRTDKRDDERSILREAQEVSSEVETLLAKFEDSTALRFPFVYWRTEVPEKYRSPDQVALHQILNKLYCHLQAVRRYFLYKRRDPAGFKLLPLARLITDTPVRDIAGLQNTGLLVLVKEHEDLLNILLRLNKSPAASAVEKKARVRQTAIPATDLRKLRSGLRTEVLRMGMDLDSAAKVIQISRRTLSQFMNEECTTNFRAKTINRVAQFLNSRR